MIFSKEILDKFAEEAKELPLLPMAMDLQNYPKDHSQ